jgi:aldose 1-epimerase
MRRNFMLSVAVLFSLVVIQSCKQPAKPSVTSDTFGKLPDGREVKIYTLTNSKGYTARVTDFGAKLVSLTVPDKNGNLADVILGYDSLSQYLKGDAFFGSTVGRYANRIAKGKFTLNGKEYQLALNNGVNHLHGGPGGYHSVLWKSEVIDKSGLPAVKLTYLSPDGEEGYPGNLQVEVTYSWSDANELRIDYAATCDQDTYINLTHHSLFNLKGAGDGDILDHELMLAADTYPPVDSTLIPTGKIDSVKNTPLDFTTPVAIGKRINDDFAQLKIGKGYDHNWVLKTNTLSDVAASLYEPVSGRLMEVYTTEPGIQIYSGNFLDGTQKGHGNKPYNFRYGLALEAQHFPDSPNQHDFPSTLLKKGVQYTQTTVYKFLTK